MIDSGLPGPSLLLTGHLDVVPAIQGEWTRPAFDPVVVDGELWGRGTVDMKGGLAALLAVFIEVATAGDPRADDSSWQPPRTRRARVAGAAVVDRAASRRSGRGDRR